MELPQKKRKGEMFLLATKLRCGMLIQIDLKENPFFISFFKEKNEVISHFHYHDYLWK
jgi:hypothetical protein